MGIRGIDFSRPSIIVIFGLVAIGFTVGVSASFVTQDILRVENDAGSSSLQIHSAGGSKQMQFRDGDVADGEKVYSIRSTPNAKRIEWISNSDSNRIDFSISTVTGNIGIGKIQAEEKLDVNGNIKLSGDIVSDSAINIRPNGDLCLGDCPVIPP